ncbi:helix-turn-helix domain-containing protein [Nocardia sp. CDC153]|uniref:helix-turn-helix domain-containing protein n=1 Tax=Nocardia sp. CDC153 TaxID=3112167 RepID=UPI002DB59DB5|nr:helix-turn-helix domain-containing protein [Nocardia sp. CDC153]MEC3956658.1 helix-turn-helix domain-containing protein [Nocardia sp. CDC153]
MIKAATVDTVDSVELVLHPVRLRIVQAFLGDRTLTTAELNAELDDVPPGSLYRHIARLVNAEVLEVVAERRVRGTVERTYRLRPAAAKVDHEALAAMSTEEQRRAFMAFVAGLVGDFDRYLARGDIDYVRDGVGYRMTGLWLDDTEFTDFAARLGQAFAPFVGNGPAPGRTLRLLRTVVLPGEHVPDDQSAAGRA